MTIHFSPDQVLPKDPAGFGQWRSGHALEHNVLRQKCAALASHANISEFDVLSWKDDPEYVRLWLESHETMHAQIRGATNVSGADLSLVDFTDDEQFQVWLDDHAQEHLIFRQILGIT